MRKSLRKALMLTAKLLLSAVLLFVVLRKVQWNEFADSLAKMDHLLAAVAALGFLFSVVAIAYRWWRLLGVQEVHVSLWEAIRLTWLGSFCNYVLLGTTGGDLVKAYFVSRHTPRKAACLMTVLVDRLSGLTGLTLFSGAMVCIVAIGGLHPAGWQGRQLRLAAWAIGGVLAVLSILAVFVFSRWVRQRLGLESFYQRLPLSGQIAQAGQAIMRFRHNVPALVRALGQTLVAQTLFLGGIALMSRSLGLEVPWYQFFIFCPLIYIISAVPVVPGGVGLVEGLYVAFFGAWASEGPILALALLIRLVPMFWVLPGAIMFAKGAKAPPAEKIQAEMFGDNGS